MISGAVPAWSTLDDWAAVVAIQIKSRQPLPIFSNYVAGLNLNDAYEIQKRVVQRLAGQDSLAGFIATLTRPMGQVEFNAREPVTGGILKAGLLQGDPALRLRDFSHLTIAPGIGFILKKRITRPLTERTQLGAFIGAVVPVVNFADVHFERATGISATDLVAGNVAFAHVLVGPPLPTLDPTSINALLVELFCDNKVVDRGRAVNVMGDQRIALMWLVNKLLQQGWDLPAGTLLVTGGFSDPVIARHGEYRAKFWDTTDLRFSVGY